MQCGGTCSESGQALVVSCAGREQLSEPSYRAEGSGQEVPWPRLHLGKINTNRINTEDQATFKWNKTVQMSVY